MNTARQTGAPISVFMEWSLDFVPPMTYSSNGRRAGGAKRLPFGSGLPAEGPGDRERAHYHEQNGEEEKGDVRRLDGEDQARDAHGDEEQPAAHARQPLPRRAGFARAAR